MSEIINFNLSNQTKVRINYINKIRDYFQLKIQERKKMSKKLSKYIAAFDYIDKNLIVWSAISGGVSIICFTSVIGTPAVIASTSFTFRNMNKTLKKPWKHEIK